MEGKGAAVLAVAVGLVWWWAQSTAPSVGPQEACSVAREARKLAESDDAADVHRAQLQIWGLDVEGSQDVQEGVSKLNGALVSLFEAHRIEGGSGEESKPAEVTQERRKAEIAFEELDQRCAQL